MQKNKYKYVSVAAMVAVMLLLGLYMWMTYRSAVRDISEQAGNQLPWAMFYESYQRAEIVSKGDTLSLPDLRGDLSLVSSVEGMNDALSRRYHSEVSLDTIALFVDSLLSVVNIDRNFTVMEVDHQGKILRQSNNLLTPTSIKTQVFSTRRDQSRGIQLALNDPYPTLAKRLSPLFLASAIILILFGAILLRLLRYLDEQKLMADLRNDFSYAMVHDMKSPLSSIIMGARFLHSGKVDDKPEIKEKYFTIIESEADHLLALVNKLLTISKLENKKLILNKQNVNLEPVIDDLIEKAKAKTEKNIDFTVDLLTKHVWADEQYLSEAISNLIDNAIKYSKDEIKINITSHSSDKYVLLKVLDNGIGISKEDQLIIFDKFGRAAIHEHNRKGGVSGFGLGLNYVDQVMQAHGGKVTVNSEKDQYSEFTLYIPKNV
jgi:two-component system phosphate regulon sensor histidine kinase PhoR